MLPVILCPNYGPMHPEILRRYHGIPRFFAFESLLMMSLLNLGSWFENPLCLRQIISWILLFGSLFPSLQGYFLLRSKGKTEGVFENTSNLVKSWKQWNSRSKSIHRSVENLHIEKVAI